MDPGVVSREATSLKVGSLPASCRPENSGQKLILSAQRQKSPVRTDGYPTYLDARFVHLHPQVRHQESGHEPKLSNFMLTLDLRKIYLSIDIAAYYRATSDLMREPDLKTA